MTRNEEIERRLAQKMVEALESQAFSQRRIASALELLADNLIPKGEKQ